MMRERLPVFTHRDLRNALVCPRKLYYKSHKYPTRYSPGGGLSHGRLLKGLLLAVTRCFADDTPIDQLEDRFLGEIHLKDFQALPDDQWYYSAAIIAGEYRLSMPIIFKQKDKLKLYQVPTKTVGSPEQKFKDIRTASNEKWERYWSDMALFTQVMKNEWPDCDIDCHLFVGRKGIRTQQIDPFEHIQLRPIAFPDRSRDILFMDEEARKAIRSEQWVEEVSVDDIVERWIELTFDHRGKFEQQLHAWKQIKLQGYETEPVLGTHCRYCIYRLDEETAEASDRNGFRECWSRNGVYSTERDHNHILEVPGHGVNEYLGKDYRWQSEVPVEMEQVDWLDWLKKRARFTMEQRQKLSLWDAHDMNVPQVMVRSGLWRELEQWAFPWHCIDFEAAHLPIPLNKESKAYERLLFQFSCHTIHADGRINHCEWLQTTSGIYPNYQLVEALLTIPDIYEGTLFQYSPFEHQALQHISNQLSHLSDDEVIEAKTPIPELREEVKYLLQDKEHGQNRWIDLHRIVNRYYFNRGSKGSLSLKELITAVLSSDSKLANSIRDEYHGSNLNGTQFITYDERDRLVNPYHTLVAKEFDVSEGSEALAAYMAMQIPNLEDERRKEIRSSMLQYGELDTFSLVILLQHWQKIHAQVPEKTDWISAS